MPSSHFFRHFSFFSVDNDVSSRDVLQVQSLTSDMDGGGQDSRVAKDSRIGKARSNVRRQDRSYRESMSNVYEFGGDDEED
jgi:hypothetical protein